MKRTRFQWTHRQPQAKTNAECYDRLELRTSYIAKPGTEKQKWNILWNCSTIQCSNLTNWTSLTRPAQVRKYSYFNSTVTGIFVWTDYLLEVAASKKSCSEEATGQHGGWSLLKHPFFSPVQGSCEATVDESSLSWLFSLLQPPPPCSSPMPKVSSSCTIFVQNHSKPQSFHIWDKVTWDRVIPLIKV